VATKKRTPAHKKASRQKAKATNPAQAATAVEPSIAVPGVFLSVNQAADEFGHDRRTVTKRIADLGIKPAMERGGFPVYRLRDLMEMERRGDDGDMDPDKMNPFERNAHFKAESERLKVDQERGTLLRREDVERDWAQIVNVIAMELETVVDEVERDVGASPLVCEKIEAKLDAVRERIYSRVVGLQAEQAEENNDA
jgi:hypothetical protein